MIRKLTKRILIISIGLLVMASALESCMLFKTHPPVYVVDPVCGEKVTKPKHTNGNIMVQNIISEHTAAWKHLKLILKNFFKINVLK